MGAAAPAVAQWIPLQGICHDFVHGWQWREVVRTRKALHPLSGLRTPPWHFLDVELVVLWQLKIVVVPVFECHDRAPSFFLDVWRQLFFARKSLAIRLKPFVPSNHVFIHERLWVGDIIFVRGGSWQACLRAEGGTRLLMRVSL